ncbi:MAG: alpha/beta hydrolase family protein [Planctomycetota bacterium]|jgi:dienelactone hydrolase
MRLACLAAAACLALAPAAGARQAEEAPQAAPDGAHAVVTVPEFVLHDPARKAELPVIVVHPKPPEGDHDGTRFPVIVFCHGLGGQGSQVLTLPRHWASHGYVVLVPTHRDSLRHRAGQGRAMGGMGKMLQRVRAPKADFQYRPADVRFLIDSLDAVVKRVPALAGRLDRDRIGTGGHSLGAYTTALVGGTRVDLPDGTDRASVGDDRVKALLMLSPQGTGRLGLSELSWDDVRRPMMTVTGSHDGGGGGKGAEWRKEPFLNAPAGDKYHCFIQGADHGFFTKPPGKREERRFGREQKKAEERPAAKPRKRGGVLTKLLGDPERPLAEMEAAERTRLIRKLERVVELGKGGKQTQGELYGRLQLLLTQLRDADWETAEATRAEILRGATTTSGETVSPALKFDCVKLLTRLFWDAHLKIDSTAAAKLVAGDTLLEAEGTVTLEHK